MVDLKRYRMETEGDMYGPIVVERHDQEFGEWCLAEEALREIATRDARIAELEIHARVEIGTREMRIAELEAAVARLSTRPTVAEHKDVQARIAELEAELKHAKFSRDWSQRRLALLQQWQSRMRDPERQIVCDILANGATLPDPDGKRYDVRDEAGETREALRDLAEDMSAPIGDDPRLGYVTVQVERAAYHAAKQLLGDVVKP